MAIPKKKSPASKKKIKQPPTQQQLHAKEMRLHERSFKSLFSKLEFKHIDTDGIEINFKKRTGEIDAIFVYENIILILEYTVGKSTGTEHVLKKKVLYDHILSNTADFIQLCREKYTGFSASLNDIYSDDLFQIRIIYASKKEPSAEAINACPSFHFMHGATAKYLQALVRSIEKSARFEFLKFLKIDYENTGETCLNSSLGLTTYQGFLLPEGNSSYPKGFKVISFYADPESLIAKSYVLRRDGWRDETHLYQRIIVPAKIRKMRKYLTDEKRVFVNNIIVTLPPETMINNLGGKNLPPAEQTKVKPVKIDIPNGFDSIGIVDGQHRVFCYHEGTDKAENEIAKLRKQQNLMVTGLVYPEDFDEIARRSFEAKLFLEINDNQARARSSLKQDIEVIIRPYSGMAIAKRVAQGLGKSGIYNGMLQTSYFDSSAKIKTSSIVSYGLRPLVKFDGADSLFSAWSNPKKNLLKEARESKDTDEHALLEAYIIYCTNKINEFFIAAKIATGHSASLWDVEANPRSELLSPTAINGLISCLRQIIQSGLPLTPESHKEKLHSMGSFKFSKYKSSHWRAFGNDIFNNHYKK